MKDLQFYIGVKAIKAKPMTRGEWRSLPRIDSSPQMSLSTDNKNDEGYLVQYENSNNPNIVGYDKYVSWSPKNVFEEAYAKSNELSIGLAFEAMRLGYVVKPSNTCIKCGLFIKETLGISLDSDGRFSIYFKSEDSPSLKTEGQSWTDIHNYLLDNNDYILDTWSIVDFVDSLK